MTTRTDAFSPKNLVTEDYEYLFADDNMRPGRLIGVDMDWWRSITNWAPEMRDRGTNQCHHCGARLRYFAILRHLPTGYAIVVGETCLDNRFSLATVEFQRLRKLAQLDREQQRIKTAAREYVASLKGDLAKAMDRDVDLAEAFPFMDQEGYAFSTISDIRRKVWDSYGAATDRQEAFVAKLIAQEKGRAEMAARIAAERASETRIDAPVGRITFEGVVVSRKWRDSDYGGAYKLVAKVDDQERGGIWLVYVTEPSKIETERGDVVRMTATLTRSDRDNSFAFGKRPSKAQVVGSVDDVENYELPDSLA